MQQISEEFPSRNFNHIRVKPDVHRKVKIAAALADMGVNEWIEMMANRALSQVTDIPALSRIIETKETS